jgi:hypothetical protein
MNEFKNCYPCIKLVLFYENVCFRSFSDNNIYYQMPLGVFGKHWPNKTALQRFIAYIDLFSPTRKSPHFIQFK